MSAVRIREATSEVPGTCHSPGQVGGATSLSEWRANGVLLCGRLRDHSMTSHGVLVGDTGESIGIVKAEGCLTETLRDRVPCAQAGAVSTPGVAWQEQAAGTSPGRQLKEHMAHQARRTRRRIQDSGGLGSERSPGTLPACQALPAVGCVPGRPPLSLNCFCIWEQNPHPG